MADQPAALAGSAPAKRTASPTAPASVGAVAKKRAKMERKRVANATRAAAKKEGKFGADPLLLEIRHLLGDELVDARYERGAQFDRPHAPGSQLEVAIVVLTAVGLGLAPDPARPDWAIVVPKSLPGDRLRVRVVKNDLMRSKAVIEEVLTKSEWRTETPACKYFGQCGGCQYQMVAYPRQLEIKRSVVQKAFELYAHLPADKLPDVLPTLPSPEQMGYRTKLTPHFNLPSLVRQWRKSAAHATPPNTNTDAAASDADTNAPPPKPEVSFPIGFDSDAGPMLDIEECPIATPAIDTALPIERAKVRQDIFSYSNGSTLLFRDSVVPASDDPDERKVVTDMKHGVMHERVGPLLFQGPAGDFFQNNRSILVPVVELIRSEISRFRATLAPSEKPAGVVPKADTYLVDAYCGAGLFALSLAPLFTRVAGVEISSRAIECARHNAQHNSINNVTFLAASAEHIFAQLAEFQPDRTTVVIDPPRKGCDEVFLTQLLQLRPRLVIYVSCNVHTQARDVGYVLRSDPAYRIFSLRAADFFPQTLYVPVHPVVVYGLVLTLTAAATSRVSVFCTGHDSRDHRLTCDLPRSLH